MACVYHQPCTIHGLYMLTWSNNSSHYTENNTIAYMKINWCMGVDRCPHICTQIADILLCIWEKNTGHFCGGPVHLLACRATGYKSLMSKPAHDSDVTIYVEHIYVWYRPEQVNVPTIVYVEHRYMWYRPEQVNVPTIVLKSHVTHYFIIITNKQWELGRCRLATWPPKTCNPCNVTMMENCSWLLTKDPLGVSEHGATQ